MTTATATLNNESTIGRLAAVLLAEVRRAIELAGAPYLNGPLPPM